ncbi:hypothetical protein TcasGA2_TC003892 [Tribolium castaneum]|uniref:Uncharacterized protein n=1 Tax=Tribolium castaneum TaxID=7070 RepID=D6WH71_TRICA|nr:hypothetical protein TcasGA2_TC003892 [Tribolium castaneum]
MSSKMIPNSYFLTVSLVSIKFLRVFGQSIDLCFYGRVSSVRFPLCDGFRPCMAIATPPSGILTIHIVYRDVMHVQRHATLVNKAGILQALPGAAPEPDSRWFLIILFPGIHPIQSGPTPANWRMFYVYIGGGVD